MRNGFPADFIQLACSGVIKVATSYTVPGQFTRPGPCRACVCVCVCVVCVGGGGHQVTPSCCRRFSIAPARTDEGAMRELLKLAQSTSGVARALVVDAEERPYTRGSRIANFRQDLAIIAAVFVATYVWTDLFVACVL